MAATITVRHPSFDLVDLPADWVGGSRLATAYGNAGHVFIPLGEQFFIDTVKAFRDRIDDEVLRRDVNAFIGQEAVHKRAHEQVWATLRARGVPVDAYARLLLALRSVEGHLPPTFRLSVTAALEHFTAAFGHSFLTEDLATAVPEEMARLLAWHGLEELEHRSVAFDVLRAVDGGYGVRVAGFAFAAGLFVAVPLTGALLFAVSDAVRDPSAVLRRGTGVGAMTARLLSRMGRHLAEYVRPGFHPSHTEPPAEADLWAALLGPT